MSKEKTLPDEVVLSTGEDPRDLVVVGIPKIGKSAILGALTRERNGIIFDLERNGYEFIDARKISIHEQGSDLEKGYQNYIEYRNLLLKEKGKYDYLIIDGLSDLDRLSELGGTLSYMYTMTIGKNFNRDKKTGEPYQISDPNFKMVTSLPEGAG